MIIEAILRGTRGLFFLSHHPLVAIVLIALVVGLIYHQSRRNR